MACSQKYRIYIHSWIVATAGLTCLKDAMHYFCNRCTYSVYWVHSLLLYLVFSPGYAKQSPSGIYTYINRHIMCKSGKEATGM